MSAEEIDISIYIYLISTQALGDVTDEWPNSQSNKVGAYLPCMTHEFRHWTHISLGNRNKHCK